MDLTPTDEESIIKSVVGILVDTESNKVAGIAHGSGVTITPNGDKTSKVLMNMGTGTQYKREHLYRIYVFANLNANTTSALAYTQAKPFTDVVGTGAETSNYSIADLSNENFRGIPMSTWNKDAVTVKVYLDPEEDYSSASTPYVVQPDDAAVYDKDHGATLTLTPLHACIGFTGSFTHTIAYKTDKDDSGISMTEATKNEVKVNFVKANIKRGADKVLLLQATETNESAFKSPKNTTLSGTLSVNIKNESGAVLEKVAYIPEFIPTLSDGKLIYKDVTYLEMIGILDASGCDAIDDKVRSAINGNLVDGKHPDLYYYDDGQFQSGLTTATHTDSGEGGTAWHKISWDTTLGGYKVVYRHAIRHMAEDKTTNKYLENDGVYDTLEYAVVRNYLYQIGINSVTALPHPWTENQEIETKNKDISVRILPPQKWTYHRGGFEISLE